MGPVVSSRLLEICYLKRILPLPTSLAILTLIHFYLVVPSISLNLVILCHEYGSFKARRSTLVLIVLL